LAPRPNSVGVPTYEERLTKAAIQGAPDLVEHADNFALLALTEVELGIGRPDVILVAADVAALSLRRSSGLRLANLTEALTLEAACLEDALAAANTRHARRMARKVAERGWFGLLRRRPIVETSLLLEAKVASWQKGVRQLSRVRWAAHRAALVLPNAVARRVNAEYLRRPGIGLVGVGDRGQLSWRHQAPEASLPFYVDAWLAELALREIERS
jgi:hypothetical protein